MPRHVFSQLLSLTAILAAGGAQAATSACRVPDFPQEVQCGVVSRPLNPDQPAGKKIDIHYVVLPSQDKNKLQDAVFLLAGGPGQSAIQVAGFGQGVLGRLNKRRDLVFVDQRGTGRSASLSCPELEARDEVLDEAQTEHRTEACLKRLQSLPHGELGMYTTSIAVQDLDAVRLAQGYDKINLVGASYGTRVGLEFLRQFPGSVRRLVLDGVVPPDMGIQSVDAQTALDGLFADCAKQERCNQAYPQLAQRWQHLLSSLPKPVTLTHPRTAATMKLDLRRDQVLGMVHRTLYTPALIAGLPYAISQADQGNFQPLVGLSGSTNLPGPAAINYGMHYSVWCSEAMAKPLPAARNEFEKTMNGMYEKACKNWPRGKVPEAFYHIPVATAPVMLLSGGIDPVTPIRNGAAVAQALGDYARHITVDNAGHGLLAHSCVRDVVVRFLSAKEDKEALATDSSCVRQIPRPLAWMPVQEKKGAQP
ncbi:alpha/beta hydrolase [Undibacterium rugosum]|uniref:Alpha/beta hydrolase n=1 Tax=Undibacterium rugosum TaxID=2762291 RepID=A0A923KYQ8_9BURK|nr:alpha/beta hydrolase [Undibacterium rugosum]MBC3934820.1 alpha/beta hydrolase [Undibacterium rugosum]MBR7778329.1 alpha/beta hydrolase [Undibacterium rugosum]